MLAVHLRGARINNLRGIDLDIDPGTLLVLCGPSGAGKSSLALSTLYAEGQRRYVESFSAYARQFLERLARPPMLELEPVPAAIAVDRGAPVKTSRSTVATLTELSDFFKQLWAAAATLTCPSCGTPVRNHTSHTAAHRLMEAAPDARVVVTYDLLAEGPEHYLHLRDSLVRDGYRRLWMDGAPRDLDALRPSDLGIAEGGSRSVEVLVDRLTTRTADRRRLVEAFDVAFRRGKGHATAHGATDGVWKFSRALRCDGCGAEHRRATPGVFSFNSPIGACGTCRGFGRTIDVDWDKVIPDTSLSLKDGAIRPWKGRATTWERRALTRFCKAESIPMDAPWKSLRDGDTRRIIDGVGGGWRTGWPGLRGWFQWLERKAYKMHVRVLLSRYRKYVPCAACDGTRFKPDVHGWRIDGLSLTEFYRRPITEAQTLVRELASRFEGNEGIAPALVECDSRLTALVDVGLGYLTLDRSAKSLSGGELQRVALTSALGSTLTGTLFVLDEPTTGLHPADVGRLISVVRRLTREDNVAIVVESDRAVIEAADRVVELGPGAGEQGGRIVFDGMPGALRRASTATARAMKPRAAASSKRRQPRAQLSLRKATGNNLRGADLEIPHGLLTCVTGVSGSGKSSLILQTLVPAVQRGLGDNTAHPLEHGGLSGVSPITHTVVVDQAPLGRTSRGNPATYVGGWDAIRKHLGKTELAKERGYKPGMFSFNVDGGRCDACKGEGTETVEMQFLADVRFSCPECGGDRFAGDVLDVTLEGKNVSEILRLTAVEAIDRFAAYPDIVRHLETLRDVGAGYLRLGQPLNTLSGGEAQRLKLAAALSSTELDGLVVLDEPTVGLHGGDVEPLLASLQALVERGNTVVVVEHDMQVAAAADHVIDLGPGAGAAGGRVVASGSPETVARAKGSQTAPFLRAALSARQAAAPRAARKSSARPGRPVFSVHGAREHNLKNISVEIPREQLVVVTGPSGSGKSTLAFDIVFAESQRRYLETLSPYVRQYLKQLPRPHVDRVVGMPPGVALEQRSTAGATNSTVGTVTEVAHYLRLAYARAGSLSCPDCDVAIEPRPLAALVKAVRAEFSGRAVSVLAPIVKGRKGSHRELLARARRDISSRARIDGRWTDLVPKLSLDRYAEHDVEVLVQQVEASSRALPSALERALKLGQGAAHVMDSESRLMLSVKRACPKCGRGFPELDPRFFSFNTRQGACPRCEGRGMVDSSPRRKRGRSQPQWSTCPDCEGGRLSGLALHTRLDGALIGEVLGCSVDAAIERLSSIKLRGRQRQIGELPVREAITRLEFLRRVGLSYLDLDRAANTLSGGEMQRVRLAAQLGSGLTGLLYVLDEPTIGLHPRDTRQLIDALRALVDRGCSVLVVEHDADMIRAADHMIDVGPVGGARGGYLVADGPLQQTLDNPACVTAAALARPMTGRGTRRPVADVPRVVLTGASQHNLQDVQLSVPVGRLVAVTGVSGSGKSTLVRQVFLRAVRKALGLKQEAVGTHLRLTGAEHFVRAVEIDQSPIGRTPRSVPATYLGVWDELRKLYAKLPEARARGYGASRFSFNVAEGRCGECDGQGALTVEMSFLPEALVHCEECDGMRFDRETLEVQLHGVSVGDLLNMDIEAARDLLSAFPRAHRPLDAMCELGLGYLKLGQPSNTLSGGEAQRLKLVAELGAQTRGGTLYVMDEPTTGLHRDDVQRLLRLLNGLVERGDTVLVIEHQPDMIMASDWVVDLGPEGGAGGGTVVAQGTPEDITRSRASHTGRALKAEARSAAGLAGSVRSKAHKARSRRAASRRSSAERPGR